MIFDKSKNGSNPREEFHLRPKYKAMERSPQSMCGELGESSAETKGADRQW